MANNNIMTGYTYVPVIVFLQVLYTWANKAMAIPAVAMPLQIQCHALKNLTFQS